MAEPIEMVFGLCTPVGPRKHELHAAQISNVKGQLLGKGYTQTRSTTLCCELCKNGWTDWSAIWVVDLGVTKEAQFQSYSNTIELSVGGGDAALCQINLTTC